MRKVNEIYRLHMERKMGVREIARSLGISHSTVSEYLSLYAESGRNWSSEIRASAGRHSAKPLPDFAKLFEELKKKGVTLALLWQEYQEDHQGKGYRYSQFCELYKKWKKKLNPSMRQRYKAGEKLFVDYAGPTIAYYDAYSREERRAALFVAVLGASNYTYAEAQSGQTKQNWNMGHVRAFEYFEGVPEQVVPDNLKSGVTSPCYYEPEINPTYHELSLHYNTVIMPARIRRAKDKAKVETGVLLVERWIMAALRNRPFFSLEELNAAIRELLERLNRKVMKTYGKSRRDLWENLEKDQLKPLPERRYEYQEYLTATVGIDYHVAYNKNRYSVPYTLIQQKLDVRVSERMVEILHKGQVVARHMRHRGQGEYITSHEHMPSNHQAMQNQWNGARLLRWAEKIGPETRQVIEAALSSQSYPEQAFRRCVGILNLTKKYGAERLEAACGRALRYRFHSYKSIKEILVNGFDRLTPGLDQNQDGTLPSHQNVRGSAYYQSAGDPHAN